MTVDTSTDLEECREACTQAREAIDNLLQALRYVQETGRYEDKLVSALDDIDEWIEDEILADCPAHVS